MPEAAASVLILVAGQVLVWSPVDPGVIRPVLHNLVLLLNLGSPLSPLVLPLLPPPNLLGLYPCGGYCDWGGAHCKGRPYDEATSLHHSIIIWAGCELALTVPSYPSPSTSPSSPSCLPPPQPPPPRRPPSATSLPSPRSPHTPTPPPAISSFSTWPLPQKPLLLPLGSDRKSANSFLSLLTSPSSSAI